MTFWLCFFSRIAMNKAFFPCKPLCLRAVNLPIKAREGKNNLQEIAFDKRQGS